MQLNRFYQGDGPGRPSPESLNTSAGFQPNAEENVSRLQRRIVIDSSKEKPIGGSEQFSWKRPICIGHVYKSLRRWSKDFPGMKQPSAPGSRSANPRPIGFVSVCGKRASRPCAKAGMDTRSNCEERRGSFWKRPADRPLTHPVTRFRHSLPRTFPFGSV
jgi:hypothetical protein